MGFFVEIYDDPSSTTLDVGEVLKYLANNFPCVQVTLKKEFCESHLEKHSSDYAKSANEDLAVAFAKSRVHDHTRPISDRKPMYGEIAYEKRRLNNKSKQPFGVVYDGWSVQSALCGILDDKGLSPSRLHVVFTNQLLATFDPGDGRYHFRTVLLGHPAIISTTGLVEAPAKPREFYLRREEARATGAGDVHIALEHEYRFRCLLHDDERLTEVAKGYALQAAYYAAFGIAFCDDKKCRLYNAHWQEEMLAAQMQGPYEICPTHESLLDSYSQTKS